MKSLREDTSSKEKEINGSDNPSLKTKIAPVYRRAILFDAFPHKTALMRLNVNIALKAYLSLSHTHFHP